VTFKGDAFLAGPNNAGKSTILAALRACTYMLRRAQRQRPPDVFQDHGTQVLGFPLVSAQLALVDENLRHEFRDVESRLVLRFSGQSRLVASWPSEESERPPFFYLQRGGTAVDGVPEAAMYFPTIGIVPILSPIDQEESVLTPKYVRENIDGRLASRHFRNQLALLRHEPKGEDLDAFIEFAQPWLAELRLRDLVTRLGERGLELDLFYVEPGRRSEKEIFWAGDGIQIWLQLLLHLFRLRGQDAIILDEPDVFLHPDLQRRLVRLLDELEGQTITATHSAEVLAEAPPESVVWIDRVRKRSIAAPDPATLTELLGSLGTQFNLRLARALRAKTVVFVEGDDMKILRQLATTVGADRVARELDIAVIGLGGFDNWERIEPFSWLVDDLLEGSVQVFVVLDRDYRPEGACRRVKNRLGALGVKTHIWKRKELESYLLDIGAAARLSGADEELVADEIRRIVSAMEQKVFARMAADRQAVAAHDHRVQALEEAKREFDESWKDEARRLWMCPPKEVLRKLNSSLQVAGFKTLAFPSLARELRADEIPAEVRNLLERIEDSS
jgi:hypothetical protein